MLLTLFFRFDSPWMLALAGGMVVLAILGAWARRPALPTAALALATAGAALLAVAAGGPVWERPGSRSVAVLVDLSASTRTATYRDRGNLDKRIAELLGDTPHQIIFFAQTNLSGDLPGKTLPDLPGQRTIYSPPTVTAVVLFSDGQFVLPEFAPPTYVVADPALDKLDDAAVARLDVNGAEVSVTVACDGRRPRSLSFSGLGPSDNSTREVTGPEVVTRPLPPGANRVTAQLSPGDAWPENDFLVADVPPAMASERWWVSASSPPPPSAAWRQFQPGDLPVEATAWLAPSIVVLDNIPATALAATQQDRLMQYVRDLGGSLIVLGGDRAFLAGGYPGSVLETLSPLASSPPRPTEHWMLLADSSGSMNNLSTGAGSATLWQLTSQAIVDLLPQLPADDLVSVGSFADDLHWWVFGQSVRQARQEALPPPGMTPHGATNLEAALQTIADAAEPALPKHLLLITDADTEIAHPDALAAALKKKNIHLHLLAIEEGKALPALEQIIQVTAGTLVRQFDPKRWREAIEKLYKSAQPEPPREAVNVRFVGELTGLPSHSALPWARTWLKPEGTLLADAAYRGEQAPMAALWPTGNGQAAAFAFEATPTEVEAVVRRIAQHPRDPRFAVTWETGWPLRVIVNAQNNGTFLNGLTLSLELSGQGMEPTSISIPQIESGRYEVDVPAPRSPVLATVRQGNTVIDRTAIAGRYAEEFEAIGNNAEKMHELAMRTGGRVIRPSEHGKIDFHWPVTAVGLASWFAAAGAALIALGLGVWRIKE